MENNWKLNICLEEVLSAAAMKTYSTKIDIPFACISVLIAFQEDFNKYLHSNKLKNCMNHSFYVSTFYICFEVSPSLWICVSLSAICFELKLFFLDLLVEELLTLCCGCGAGQHDEEVC